MHEVKGFRVPGVTDIQIAERIVDIAGIENPVVVAGDTIKGDGSTHKVVVFEQGADREGDLVSGNVVLQIIPERVAVHTYDGQVLVDPTIRGFSIQLGPDITFEHVRAARVALTSKRESLVRRATGFLRNPRRR